MLNLKGVLKKEIDVTVKKLKIAPNSILSADQIKVLAEANGIAEEIFGGSHGLTDRGYLIFLPDDKKKLPHPVERLTLDVNEGGVAADLISMQEMMQKVIRKRHNFLSLHMHHLKEGYKVDVEVDALGIKLI